jgi:hypothetical protein
VSLLRVFISAVPENRTLGAKHYHWAYRIVGQLEPEVVASYSFVFLCYLLYTRASVNCNLLNVKVPASDEAICYCLVQHVYHWHLIAVCKVKRLYSIVKTLLNVA